MREVQLLGFHKVDNSTRGSLEIKGTQLLVCEFVYVCSCVLLVRMIRTAYMFAPVCCVCACVRVYISVRVQMREPESTGSVPVCVYIYTFFV